MFLSAGRRASLYILRIAGGTCPGAHTTNTNQALNHVLAKYTGSTCAHHEAQPSIKYMCCRIQCGHYCGYVLLDSLATRREEEQRCPGTPPGMANAFFQTCRCSGVMARGSAFASSCKHPERSSPTAQPQVIPPRSLQPTQHKHHIIDTNTAAASE